MIRTHIIQSADLFGPPERQAELMRVWKINEVLFDRITSPEGRPTFTELFRMCLPGVVNVIANADIHFDAQGIATVARFYAEPKNNKAVMALSRWDVRPDGNAYLWDHPDSQDSFVIYGGPHELPDADQYTGTDAKTKPLTMGLPGCDNRLVHVLMAAGYTVLNPSKTIRSYHIHQVDWRSYLNNQSGTARGGQKIERVPPPYALVAPTEL